MNLKNYVLPLAVVGSLASGQTLADTYIPVSIEALRANPAQYAGKNVEVRGVPYGISLRGDSAVFVYFYITSSMHKGAMQKRGILVSSAVSSPNLKGGGIAALIDSEIRDGDQEEITVKGEFKENGVLSLASVTANGYTVTKFKGIKLSK